MHFPVIWTPWIWKFLDIQAWEEIQQIYERKIKPWGVYRNMKDVSLKVVSKY